MPAFRVSCTNFDSVASLDVWATYEDEAIKLAQKIIPKRYWYNIYILNFDSPMRHPWDKDYRFSIPWNEGRLWMTEGLDIDRTTTIFLEKSAIKTIVKDWALVCKAANKFSSKEVIRSFKIPADYLYWAGWKN